MSFLRSCFCLNKRDSWGWLDSLDWSTATSWTNRLDQLMLEFDVLILSSLVNLTYQGRSEAAFVDLVQRMEVRKLLASKTTSKGEPLNNYYLEVKGNQLTSIPCQSLYIIYKTVWYIYIDVWWYMYNIYIYIWYIDLKFLDLLRSPSLTKPSPKPQEQNRFRNRFVEFRGYSAVSKLYQRFSLAGLVRLIWGWFLQGSWILGPNFGGNH